MNPVDLLARHGTVRAAAEAAGIAKSTFFDQLKKATATVSAQPTNKPLTEAVRSALKSGGRTLAQLKQSIGAGDGLLLDAIEQLREAGVNVVRLGDRFEIPPMVEQSFTKGSALELVSNDDNTFLIGATGDWHVASKYHREDVL